MKIKSKAEFDHWICQRINDAMKKNLQGMREHGISEADIDNALPCLINQCEFAREVALNAYDEVMCDFEGVASTVH
jgi:hypothetical protein